MGSVGWKRVIRRALRGLLFVAAFLLALPAAYAVAAAVGGLITVNNGWREPPEGVTIFVRTNGVHTWVVVPTVTREMDWRPLAPAEHLRDPSRAGDYLAFGFGNRDFYLNTPAWRDLSPRAALVAALGRGPALLHVDHVQSPRPGARQRALRIRRAEYRRLVAFIRESFALRHTRSVPLLGRGYTSSDMFYESGEAYNFTRTCNEWTGEALRAAGVRTAAWSPFAQGITAHLPER